MSILIIVIITIIITVAVIRLSNTTKTVKTTTSTTSAPAVAAASAPLLQRQPLGRMFCFNIILCVVAVGRQLRPFTSALLTFRSSTDVLAGCFVVQPGPRYHALSKQRALHNASSASKDHNHPMECNAHSSRSCTASLLLAAVIVYL